jgi:hypothetical protein
MAWPPNFPAQAGVTVGLLSASMIMLLKKLQMIGSMLELKIFEFNWLKKLRRQFLSLSP